MTIRIALAVVAFVGAMMVVVTFGAERFDPPNWGAHGGAFDPGADSDSASQRFFRAREAHRTRASRVQDLGRGLLALGGALLALTWAAGITRVRSLRSWHTPRHRVQVWILAFGAWITTFVANDRWLMYKAHRGDYPWWADTMAIPIGANYAMALFGAPVLGVVVLVALWGLKTPVSLAHLSLKAPQFWIASPIALVVAYFLLIGLGYDVLDGAFPLVVGETMALAALVVLWLAASVRRAS